MSLAGSNPALSALVSGQWPVGSGQRICRYLCATVHSLLAGPQRFLTLAIVFCDGCCLLATNHRPLTTFFALTFSRFSAKLSPVVLDGELAVP